jgi:hypothetical protein
MTVYPEIHEICMAKIRRNEGASVFANGVPDPISDWNTYCLTNSMDEFFMGKAICDIMRVKSMDDTFGGAPANDPLRTSSLTLTTSAYFFSK